MKNLIIIILVVALAGFGYYTFFRNSEISILPSSSSTPDKNTVSKDIMPLPSGLTWGDPVDKDYEGYVTNDSGDTTTLHGSQVSSKISTKKVDVINYYDTKLTKLGWQGDDLNQSEGVIGSTAAYKKGGKHIIIESNTEFLGAAIPESPLNCPCQYTYTVFVEK